ncbi:thioredoxin-disulfide reductase [Patescibacteria group bacterium]
MTYDLIIIGSGPAGFTAGIYTSRANMSTLIIGGNPSGGQLATTTGVENFPGFPEGIMGPDLINSMRKQAERFGSEIIDKNVISIEGNFSTGFKVKTEDGGEIESSAVLVCSGASPKWLGLESEQRLRGKGVSSCATCDGFFFKDKVIAVIGGGDAAMEESLFLTKFATKVYVLIRGSEENIRASKIMQDRARANPKIEFMCNTEVQEVLGNDSVEGLRVVNNQTKEEKTMSDVGGMFVAIGHKPSSEFLKGFVDLDEKGYVKVIENTKTSKEGVFAAGDVVDYRYRQAVTAAGFGCMAALDVEKFLSQK